MIWLIFWLPSLEEGKWPSEIEYTGYTEMPIISKGHHSPFENACLIAAELRCRLVSTKDAGDVLIHEVQHGLDDYRLLSALAQQALNYISGWRRRRIPFSQWRASRKRYMKIV